MRNFRLLRNVNNTPPRKAPQENKMANLQSLSIGPREFWIDTPYSHAMDITKDDSISTDCDDAVRLYKSSPGGITLQIRATGKVTDHGKEKRMISSVELNRKECEALKVKLAEFMELISFTE